MKSAILSPQEDRASFTATAGRRAADSAGGDGGNPLHPAQFTAKMPLTPGLSIGSGFLSERRVNIPGSRGVRIRYDYTITGRSATVMIPLLREQ
jgi:hypothetical protein